LEGMRACVALYGPVSSPSSAEHPPPASRRWWCQSAVVVARLESSACLANPPRQPCSCRELRPTPACDGHPLMPIGMIVLMSSEGKISQCVKGQRAHLPASRLAVPLTHSNHGGGAPSSLIRRGERRRGVRPFRESSPLTADWSRLLDTWVDAISAPWTFLEGDLYRRK
jgi:hypothetical protein